jgi:flagellar motility protein MotE (MotC chaperone)
MDARLPAIEGDSLERYFAVLSKLVLKLEDPERSLGQIMNEMMAESAAIIMQEMQSRR